MKRINIYVNSVLRWSAYKRESEYQAWIDTAVAANLWGLPGTYTVEILDATAEIESNRLQAEGISKQSAESTFEPKNVNIQSHISSVENPHSVTKAQVGLGLVDNTSDLSKPISTQAQSALDLKANSSDVNSALALKANSSSVYTKAESDTIASNTLSAANSYADVKTAAIVNSAPATLDTLNELATALGNDPNFATTTATLIGTKADSSSVYTKAQSDTNYEPKNSNIQSHISNLSNPHAVTKAQVGLSNVDNTSDANKPVSLLTQDALDAKVDFVLGKQLSENDFTNAYKTKVDGIQAGATANDTDANLRTRSTHTGNESQLTWNESISPSVPVSGLTTYSQNIGGRQMFGQLGKSGVAYTFQPFLARNKVTIWQANGSSTTSTIIGSAAPTASGTATTRNVATTNFFSWIRRLGYVSNTTGNSTAGLRHASLQYGLGNSARTGGFHFVARFGISDATLVTGARLFVGMTSSTAALGNSDPSSFNNIIGVGMDAADTTLQLMHNDAAGVATKIDLGVNFPESTNTDMFELSLYCAPNGSTVFYEVINLTTNIEVSGSITTNLPLNTQLLAWQIWRHNVSTGLAVGIDVSSVYIETDN